MKPDLPGLRIHGCRHTWASQGVMNGGGLTTVGRLLGHRQRETTVIYAPLDDGALRDAAAQAAAIIARAMGYKAEAPPMPDEAEHGDILTAMPKFSITDGPPHLPEGEQTPLCVRPKGMDGAELEGDVGVPPKRPSLD